MQSSNPKPVIISHGTIITDSVLAADSIEAK
jgi:hypothetical protein